MPRLPGIWSTAALAATLCGWFLLPVVSMAPAIELVVFWAAAAVVPGLLWTRRQNWENAYAGMAWSLSAGWFQLFLWVFLSKALGFGYESGSMGITAGLLLPWLLAPGKGCARRHRHRVLLAALGFAAALGLWLSLHPKSLHILSDAPAHLAAARDALEQGEWRPLDPSTGDEPAHDPRFGLLHGIYGYASSWTGVDATGVFESSAAVSSPLWFLLHFLLFRQFLGGAWLSLGIALLYTITASAGRGFGLWSAVYPGNVAISLAAGCVASALPWLTGAQRGRSVALLSAVGIGASCWVHPFAWWAWGAILLHVLFLGFLSKAQVGEMRRVLVYAGIALMAGALVMLPQAWAHARAEGGLHDIPVFVVYVGDSLFFSDPQRVARWGGSFALVAFPFMLVAWRAWAGSLPRRILLASAAAVWTLALNPLLHPVLYRIVGYFPERVGLMVYSPVVLVLLAEWTRARWLLRPSIATRVFLFLFLSAAAAFMASELKQSVRTLDSAAGREAVYWRRLSQMATALDEASAANFISDPRTSYGLRALRGGRSALYPVSHASPLDSGLESRLAAYRTLLRGESPRQAWEQALQALDARYLIVNESLGELYRGREFGFVARDQDQVALRQRLQAWGLAAVAAGSDWALFDLGPLDVEADSLPGAGSRTEAGPASIRCIGVEILPSVIARGDSLDVFLEFEALQTEARWQAVYLRVESEDMGRQEGSSLVAKPLRKLAETFRPTRRRFGRWHVPFAGLHDPASWTSGTATERVRVRIPQDIEAGRYWLEVSTHEIEWGYTRELRDFLSERDRFSSNIGATFRVTEQKKTDGAGR